MDDAKRSEIAKALGASVVIRVDVPHPGTPIGMLSLAYWFDERQRKLRLETSHGPMAPRDLSDSIHPPVDSHSTGQKDLD